MSLVPGNPNPPAPPGASAFPPPTPRADDASWRRRVRAARLIAIAADLIQIVILPLAVAGALSPWDDALDVVVSIVMIRLLGWHLAFLPAMITELVPFADLIPTWTAAVFFVTRKKKDALPKGARPS